jgi:tetratricopeptide (TPR) repeat protein/tRNA A-37 threonylcarbamoyl transferase component Bud32
MAEPDDDIREPSLTEVDQTMPLPASSLPRVGSRPTVENTAQQVANAETAEDLRDAQIERTVQLSIEVPVIAAAPSPAPTTGGGTRFNILRPWREGGLGKVSIARDQELNREVALKEIKPQHATSKNNQERFLIEGEITGQLEHPGIVPVYGMGRYKDGQPYYAMRFVHGDSLEEAIAHFHRTYDHSAHKAGERAVAFRELIHRFIAVCHAMAYAHSRGVIHRDLKPSNILLAKYGETLVVDWGLAKVAGQTDLLGADASESGVSLQSGTSATATRLGSVIGTPAYMSPEQAEGRHDLMGPATDIYSLGATLYCVLTGHSPFTATHLREVLDKVKRGDFQPPRAVRPKLPKALNAICLKAMALKREDRYKTAGELASDIEHWLADEPVTAYPEGARERAVRWIRRHRTLALAVALALVTVSAVSIVATLLVNEQRLIANEAKENADVAFHQARDAVDDLFTKVSEDTLLNQPGMQGLRGDLLQKTLDYYERFLKQRADDPALKEELGMTLFRAGRIVDELQSPENALPKLKQAAVIQNQLVTEKPGDAKRLQSLGDTHNAMGRSLHRGQHLDEAATAYGTSKQLRQKLVDLEPQNAEYRRALANSLMNLGLVDQDRGKLDDAATQLQAAQQIRETAAAGEKVPEETAMRLQRDMAMGSYNLGNLAVDQGDLAAAAKHYSAAIERFQSLHEQEPRDLRIQFLLATTCRKAGDALATSSPEEAATMYERARTLLANLADRNPEVGEYQAALAALYMNIGFRQELVAAAANFEKAESILRKLVDEHPRNRRFRRDLAVTQRELGVKQIDAGQRDAGLKNLRQSVEALETLVKEAPQDDDFERELKTSRDALENAAARPVQVETA